MRETQKKTVTAKEVAEMYGIAEGTLANMRSQKRGPKYYKCGGRRKVLYALVDVEDWITCSPVLTEDSLPEDE